MNIFLCRYTKCFHNSLQNLNFNVLSTRQPTSKLLKIKKLSISNINYIIRIYISTFAYMDSNSIIGLYKFKQHHRSGDVYSERFTSRGFTIIYSVLIYDVLIISRLLSAAVFYGTMCAGNK